MDELVAKSDDRGEKIVTCREIVRKIVEFGADQDQIVMIMHLLAFELHDLEQMQELSSITREVLRERKFLFIDSDEEPGKQ